MKVNVDICSRIVHADGHIVGVEFKIGGKPFFVTYSQGDMAGVRHGSMVAELNKPLERDHDLRATIEVEGAPVEPPAVAGDDAGQVTGGPAEKALWMPRDEFETVMQDVSQVGAGFLKIKSCGVSGVSRLDPASVMIISEQVTITEKDSPLSSLPDDAMRVPFEELIHLQQDVANVGRGFLQVEAVDGKPQKETRLDPEEVMIRKGKGYGVRYECTPPPIGETPTDAVNVAITGGAFQLGPAWSRLSGKNSVSEPLPLGDIQHAAGIASPHPCSMCGEIIRLLPGDAHVCRPGVTALQQLREGDPVYLGKPRGYEIRRTDGRGIVIPLDRVASMEPEGDKLRILLHTADSK